MTTIVGTPVAAPTPIVIVPVEEARALMAAADDHLVELRRAVDLARAEADELERAAGAGVDAETYEWVAIRLHRFVEAIRAEANAEIGTLLSTADRGSKRQAVRMSWQHLARTRSADADGRAPVVAWVPADAPAVARPPVAVAPPPPTPVLAPMATAVAAPVPAAVAPPAPVLAPPAAPAPVSPAPSAGLLPPPPPIAPPAPAPVADLVAPQPTSDPASGGPTPDTFDALRAEPVSAPPDAVDAPDDGALELRFWAEDGEPRTRRPLLRNLRAVSLQAAAVLLILAAILIRIG